MKMRVFLDSGAFTAHTKGRVVKIKDYLRFLDCYGDNLYGYASLDVIPRARTPEAVEEAAAASWKNYICMKKAGFNPIPVYHMGERRYWLEKMLGEGPDCVGLGGLALVRDSARRLWLDETFHHLQLKSFGTKVHGFGMTSVSLIHAYPWSSVDSWFWISSARGVVFMPVHEHGSENYKKPPLSLRVCVDSEGGVCLMFRRGGLIGPATKDLASRFFTREGFRVSDLKHRSVRDRLNVRVLLRSANAHSRRDFSYKANPSLFTAGLKCCAYSLPDTCKFTLFFAVEPRNSMSVVMQKEGVSSVLLSYATVRNRSDLNTFVSTGKWL